MRKIYYCKKCNKNHHNMSNIGWNHIQYNDILKSIQREKISTSIEWTEKYKNSKIGFINFGKIGKNYFIGNIEFIKLDKIYQYQSLYRILNKKENIWEKYYIKHWEMKKQDDKKAFIIIKNDIKNKIYITKL